MDERRDSTLIDAYLIDAYLIGEQRVWHGLRPLIDVCIIFGCSVHIVRDRIPGSVVAMANIQQSRTEEQYKRIPGKKAAN